MTEEMKKFAPNFLKSDKTAYAKIELIIEIKTAFSKILEKIKIKIKWTSSLEVRYF